jgi:hypothetical protein
MGLRLKSQKPKGKKLDEDLRKRKSDCWCGALLRSED